MKTKILFIIHLLPLLVFVVFTYITNVFKNYDNAMEVFCFALLILSSILCLGSKSKAKYIGVLFGVVVFLCVLYDLNRINQLILFKHWSFLLALITYLLTGYFLVVEYCKEIKNK
jgi:hypothetical protein